MVLTTIIYLVVLAIALYMLSYTVQHIERQSIQEMSLQRTSAISRETSRGRLEGRVEQLEKEVDKLKPTPLESIGNILQFIGASMIMIGSLIGLLTMCYVLWFLWKLGVFR